MSFFGGTEPKTVIFRDGRQKACGHDNLSTALLVGLLSNLLGISDDLINFWDESLFESLYSHYFFSCLLE